MKKLILQKGQLSSIHVHQKSENENVFSVKLFLGDPEEPTAVIDLETLSHDSALKLFRTIETNVSKTNAEISLSAHAPEIMKMIEEGEL